MTQTKFSLSRAFALAAGTVKGGIEQELSEELYKRFAGNPAISGGGIIIPLFRALGGATESGGGALVASEVNDVAAALRPYSVALRAGATMVQASPDQVFPRITSGASASWLSEGATVSESTPSVGTLNLQPRRVSCAITASNQLLSQAALADAIIRRDLSGALGQALDVGIFSGVGGAEPIGLCLNSNILTPVTFGGAPVLADVCDFEKAIADEHAEQGSMAWVMSIACRSKWRQVATFSGGSTSLFDLANSIAPAFGSSAVSSNLVIYGNFADLVIVHFGALQVIADTFSKALEHKTRFIGTLLLDAGPIRVKSFARSTDAGNQS